MSSNAERYEGSGEAARADDVATDGEADGPLHVGKKSTATDELRDAATAFQAGVPVRTRALTRLRGPEVFDEADPLALGCFDQFGNDWDD